MGIGDRVRVDRALNIVIGVSGARVRLADEAGNVQTVTVTELASDARFELADGAPRGAVVPDGGERPSISSPS